MILLATLRLMRNTIEGTRRGVVADEKLDGATPGTAPEDAEKAPLLDTAVASPERGSHDS